MRDCEKIVETKKCSKCKILDVAREDLILCTTCINSIQNYSNVDIFNGYQDLDYPLQTTESLEEEFAKVHEENRLNKEALVLLISQCKKYNFNPFPEDSHLLNKPIKDMTKEELAERNKEITKRIEKNRQVRNSESLKPPTFEQLEELYKPTPMDIEFVNKILQSTSTKEQITEDSKNK
jgi:hypothetical protein